MTDERRLSPLDRRQMLPRAGGRRRTDIPADHATRARYQAGCRCTPCKAANAAYIAFNRQQRLRGLPPLGAAVSAAETWRQLRVLLKEYGSKRELAQRLGLHDRHLQFGRRRVRHETADKVRRIYEMDIKEAPYSAEG